MWVYLYLFDLFRFKKTELRTQQENFISQVMMKYKFI